MVAELGATVWAAASPVLASVVEVVRVGSAILARAGHNVVLIRLVEYAWHYISFFAQRGYLV